MRCVPPHSHTVTLYTGRQAGLGSQAGWGWAGLTVLCCVCFGRKDNTEDDTKDSDGDNINDSKNLRDNYFCTLPDETRLDIRMMAGSGEKERDEDDHSKLLVTKIRESL